MITLIVLAASYLNFVLGILGIPSALANTVAKLGTDPVVIALALCLFYLILGCFMETLSMMIGTIPVVFPLVVALGIDPVWFGIFLILMCELSLITPPVGMNLYVVQGVRGEGSIKEVIVGTIPFALMMLALVGVLIYFPEVATWLPNKAFEQ
jgi:TRAP-type C4-dicarboxylate transport system permease large subunit